MIPTHRSGHCDVCDRDGVDIFVYALPFAPMSIGSCSACIAKMAYPLWAVHGAIWCAGGLDHCAGWFMAVRSFKDGQYIEWPEIVNTYDPSRWDEGVTDAPLP